jgi:plasmid stabilization system protein ParE
MKIIWAPLAIDRIAEIAAYIAQDNSAAAEKWIDDAFKRVGQLVQFPKSGRHIPESRREEIRELIWKNYRIIYRVKIRELAILTVRHTKEVLPIKDLK